MLQPEELATEANLIFAAPSIEAAARAKKLEIMPIRVGPSSCWRLIHHETPAPIAILPPLFGEAPALPPRQIAQARLWASRNARLAGRRGLVGEDGTLFLAGPISSDADMARAIADCAEGAEGLMLRADTAQNAQLLAPLSKGVRRINGVGLHLGAAAGKDALPFLFDGFLALLLIAELRPKLDYLVMAEAPAELSGLLAEIGLGGVKILDLDRMQGVVCSEILMPVIAKDPAGWLDSASLRRIRSFAAGLLTDLGSCIYPEAKSYFLTSSGGERGALATVAAAKGYLVRPVDGRGLVERALLMTQASQVATDCVDGVTTTLFADAAVPVLDFTAGDTMPRLPLLAGVGRRYALVSPDDAAAAFARIGTADDEAA